jgi:hypothetical protein
LRLTFYTDLEERVHAGAEVEYGGQDQQQETAGRETANDRFKRGFNDWFWISADPRHPPARGAFPPRPLRGGRLQLLDQRAESIELPDEIEIPPPPEAIQRPATPVIAEATIDEDITIAPTTFEDNPIENLPPPPSGDTDLSAGARRSRP